LLIEMSPDAVVRKWLPFFFSLLELREDFADKVIYSALEAISRTTQNESLVRWEHIHLLVLIPENHELNFQNWGFFRIEKVGNETEQSDSGHMIEIYLYQEG